MRAPKCPASQLPSARPPMNEDSTRLLAHTPFPNAMLAAWNQSVSKRSAAQPERSAMKHAIGRTRAIGCRAAGGGYRTAAGPGTARSSDARVPGGFTGSPRRSGRPPFDSDAWKEEERHGARALVHGAGGPRDPGPGPQDPDDGVLGRAGEAAEAPAGVPARSRRREGPRARWEGLRQRWPLRREQGGDRGLLDHRRGRPRGGDRN